MNKNLLRSHMAKHGDTQAVLAEAMGISLSRLNAKINQAGGAEFTQTEMAFIADRYGMTPKDINHIFFAQKVS